MQVGEHVPSQSNRKAAPTRGHRYGGSAGGAIGRSVSWGDVEASVLHRAVVAVTGAGDALTFGRTSDGGGFYVGALADGQLERFYMGSVEDAVQQLAEIAAAGEALVE